MISQIETMKTNTQPLPQTSRDLIPLRRLHLSRGGNTATTSSAENLFWNHFTAGPYLVPISRRVE